MRADLGVRGHVHGAGGVVKDQHARALEKRAGNAEALLLAAGDVDAALTQVPVEAADAVKELVHAGHAADLEELLVASVGRAPLQVLPDGADEQHVLLEHDAHGVPQRGEVVLAHVVAAHGHPSGGDVVEARDELHERGLARARGTQDAHGGACRQVESDV